MQISPETRRLAQQVRNRVDAVPGSKRWSADQFYEWMDNNVSDEEGAAVFAELLEIEGKL